MIANLVLASYLAQLAPPTGHGPHLQPGFHPKAGDFPHMTFSDWLKTRAIVDMTIDSRGRPYACEVALPSKFERLNAEICPVLLARIAFSPGVDEELRPITSVTRIILRLAEDQPRTKLPLSELSFKMYDAISEPSYQAPPPDMVARIRAMPTGLRDPAQVIIRRVENGDGTVESCAVEEASGAPTLDALACRATATNRFGRKAVVDARGGPIRALRLYVIRFTAGALPQAATSDE